MLDIWILFGRWLLPVPAQVRTTRPCEELERNAAIMVVLHLSRSAETIVVAQACCNIVGPGQAGRYAWVLLAQRLRLSQIQAITLGAHHRYWSPLSYWDSMVLVGNRLYGVEGRQLRCLHCKQLFRSLPWWWWPGHSLVRLPMF